MVAAGESEDERAWAGVDADIVQHGVVDEEHEQERGKGKSITSRVWYVAGYTD